MHSTLSRNKKTPFTILIVFCFFLSSHSQSINKKLHFTSENRKKVTIPFKLSSNLIIIPIKINDSPTLQFILDTGIKTAIITELYKDDSVSLNFFSEKPLFGLGAGKALTSYITINNTYYLKKVIGEYQTILYLKEDVFQLSAQLGTKVNGLIGWDIFKNFIVEINYRREYVRLHHRKKFEYPKSRKWTSLPLTFHDGKPYIKARITQFNGTEMPVKLLIDTGAGMPLWLSSASDEKIIVPEKHINTFIGQGLNGDVHGKLGRIKKITIGEMEIEDVITAFPDTITVATSLIAGDNRNGSIGAELLNRFHLIIDYYHKKISLKPNSNFKKAFEYNKSGLTIIEPAPGIPVYTVSFIREESPADSAGLKIYDQLLRIGNQPVSDMKLDQINNFLFGRKGNKVYITVLRDGERIKTTLNLYNEI